MTTLCPHREPTERNCEDIGIHKNELDGILRDQKELELEMASSSSSDNDDVHDTVC